MIGDRDESARHSESLADWLGSLPVGPGDLVTLVPAQSFGDPGSATGETCAAEVAAIKRSLAPETGKGPKVVAYNPLKRWA